MLFRSVGGFRQVNLKLDNVVDQIHQNIEKQGELIREAIRQTMSTAGRRGCPLLPSYLYNAVNITYQKFISVMPPTPDSIPTQGAWNA